jgi:hypothetical protein
MRMVFSVMLSIFKSFKGGILTCEGSMLTQKIAQSLEASVVFGREGQRW